MCRTFTRLIKITLPFNGTESEKQNNIDSHTWRVVDMEQRYGVRGLPKITECVKCKVVADTPDAHWPCGMCPTPISYDEYSYMMKNRNSDT